MELVVQRPGCRRLSNVTIDASGIRYPSVWTQARPSRIDFPRSFSPVQAGNIHFVSLSRPLSVVSVLERVRKTPVWRIAPRAGSELYYW